MPMSVLFTVSRRPTRCKVVTLHSLYNDFVLSGPQSLRLGNLRAGLPCRSIFSAPLPAALSLIRRSLTTPTLCARSSHWSRRTQSSWR